ncbi:hypothetical protein H3966_11275 [Staphylococcus epidermidis]|uniref:hypothetical protein n=1 Tax=Staphylococcus TaxID=1279 RepID=UPI000F3CAE7C|nr:MULTISPECIES: hypothetical protein [Staphylococcus]MBF2226369.1 hypothetical protein [Staphylococcus epidermidis]RNG65154.1 hypothetical protein D1G04_13915 [Staphylococcus aureus]
MRAVIQRLLDSDDSAYKISKETGVYSSVIQRLRLGEQAIEDSKYGNIERLYEYQLDKEMNIALNQDRYSQYRENVKAIKNSEDIQFKYKTLLRSNGNIAMALRSTFSAIGIEHNSEKTVYRLLYKMVNLLVLEEGEKIKAIENLNDVFYIIDANNNYRYISIVEGKDEADIRKTFTGSLNIAGDIKTLSVKVDISSDVRNYLVIISEDLDDILEFNIAINKKMIEDQKHIQQIVDRL